MTIQLPQKKSEGERAHMREEAEKGSWLLYWDMATVPDGVYMKDVWRVWLMSSTMSRTRRLGSAQRRYGSGEVSGGGSHVDHSTIFWESDIIILE